MKKIIVVLSLFLIFICSGTIAFASSENTNTIPTNSINTNVTNTSGNTDNNFEKGDLLTEGELPKVTTDAFGKWLETKGFEIVKLLQRVGQPIALITFILCAFLALFGAFGNSQLLSKGIWGMAISVIIFATILYAQDIVQALLMWIKS